MRGLLLLKGKTLSEWAREHEYPIHLVVMAMNRFVGRDKRPRRGLTRKIIEALEQETGMRLCGKEGEGADGTPEG